MRIFIEDSFDSAHWLPNVPEGHKCRNMHGHTYHVRLEFGGLIDQHTGWIIDYAEAKQVWDHCKAILDHKCLNDVIPNPTCERLAEFICDHMLALPLQRIELRETDRCGVVMELQCS